MIASCTTAELLVLLHDAGVPAVEPTGRNVHAFMNDPAERHRGRVAEVPHPQLGCVRELDVLLRISMTTPVPHRLAPGLGEHTDDVLSELGASRADIAGLRTRGVVR
jgi:crotonobetainyl-CoA:carnitine CoA-transferase CaiB-like acyl-CoA transferase